MKWLAFLLLLFAGFAQAANLHIRDGATGSTCADWGSNACDTLPASLNRGDTYYIADGSYAGYTFDDNNSGTTRITIKKAIESDHGSSTGWLSTYGDGQAVFNGDFNFDRGYYTVDGQAGGGPTAWETGFGILVNGGVAMPQFVDNNSDDIILQHIDFDIGEAGPSDIRGMTLYGADGFTISYVYIHDAGCDMISMNEMIDFTVEYSKIARNYQAEPGCHGDVFEFQIDPGSNFIVRWSFFEDVVGTYIFGAHGTPATVTGYEIYGNIFYFTSGWSAQGFFGNGMLGTIGSGSVSGMKFYNNTIAGSFNTDSGLIGCCGGTGNITGEFRNTVFWQSSAATYNAGTGGGTSSANTCYTGSTVCEQDLSGTPFTNFSGRDLSLTSAAATAQGAGTTLGSPYNVDMFGVTRGADGKWDRGAIEFDEGGGGLDAPTNFRLLLWAGGLAWLLRMIGAGQWFGRTEPA